MKRLSLSVVAIGAVLAVSTVACKKERGSSTKSETAFNANDRKDLLNYDKDYTQAEFEESYNALFKKGEFFEGYKCKVRKIQKFRNAAGKPELAPFQKLEDSELIGIDTYTGFAYTKINRPLRTIKNNQDALVDDLKKPEGARMTEDQRKKLQADIEQAYKDIEPWRLVVMAASSGLNKLPKYDKPVIRGATLRDEFIKGYCEKECAASADQASCKPSTEAAFMSTTLNTSLGGFQGNTKFAVTGDSGRAVNAISQFPSEGEVLFAPGADFIVTAVRFSDGRTCKEYLAGTSAPAATPPAATTAGSADGSSGPTSPSPSVGTDGGAGASPSIFLADADPTDCPEFVASNDVKSTTTLAQTSIGEAKSGASTIPPGLSEAEQSMLALTSLNLVGSLQVEIDLKEVHR